jgi:hypothetical protein
MLLSQSFFFADESCCCRHPVLSDCKKCFQKISQHPITKHVGLLLMFATFNIFLPLADFVTDILTAQSFFQSDHFYWGGCTLFFVILPFLGRLLVFIFSIAKCFFGKLESNIYPNKMTEFQDLCSRGFPELIWHFPPLIVLR